MVPSAPPHAEPAAPPRLLLTCGDPAGIGPEIVCRAWADPAAHARTRLRVVAAPATLADALARRPGMPRLRVTCVAADDPRPSDTAELLVIDPAPGRSAPAVEPGIVSATGGRAALDALATAATAVRAGRAAALVTGPVHKEALHAAGCDVPGHTELLARHCGLAGDAVSMLLWLPRGAGGLGVVHATLHESLRTALARLSSDGIVAAGMRLVPALEALLGRAPRIAVAALNPHGGEHGLFGDDEGRVVEPAVRRLAAAGIDVAGPLPADTLFVRAAAGGFDGVVALYHDQGHIPIKLLGMHRAVNVTLGLPLVRTSVAHGTAFDIVGTGAADPAGMLAAIAAALRLVDAGWPAAQGPQPGVRDASAAVP